MTLTQPPLCDDCLFEPCRCNVAPTLSVPWVIHIHPSAPTCPRVPFVGRAEFPIRVNGIQVDGEFSCGSESEISTEVAGKIRGTGTLPEALARRIAMGIKYAIMFEHQACTKLSREHVNKISLVDLLVHVKISPSKTQARRDIEGGGIYINNERELTNRLVIQNDFYSEYCLLRRGKKLQIAVEIEESP